MNLRLASTAAILLLLCILGCDSPPWSRFIIANTSQTDVTVRFYVPTTTVLASPCLYSAEEWKKDALSCSGTPRNKFTMNEKELWIETILPPGGAVEIDRARYPDVEENVNSNFLIDRLDIHGQSGDISWAGRREVFSHLQKEGGPFWFVSGTSPRYVYYYK